MNLKRLTLLLMTLPLASSAFAHTGAAEQGLVSGLLHPLTGLDHLLAMIAVGVLAVRGGKKVAWGLPLSFAALLLLGAVGGVAFGDLSGVEFLVALSLVALGGLLLSGRNLGAVALLALVGSSALLHGLAHGGEASGAVWAYLSGMTATTLALHLGGIALGRLLVARGALSLRLYGGATGLAGAVLIAGLL